MSLLLTFLAALLAAGAVWVAWSFWSSRQPPPRARLVFTPAGPAVESFTIEEGLR